MLSFLMLPWKQEVGSKDAHWSPELLIPGYYLTLCSTLSEISILYIKNHAFNFNNSCTTAGGSKNASAEELAPLRE